MAYILSELKRPEDFIGMGRYLCVGLRFVSDDTAFKLDGPVRSVDSLDGFAWKRVLLPEPRSRPNNVLHSTTNLEKLRFGTQIDILESKEKTVPGLDHRIYAYLNNDENVPCTKIVHSRPPDNVSTEFRFQFDFRDGLPPLGGRGRVLDSSQLPPVLAGFWCCA